ncbi:MAG TPA: oligoendopeptidase F [Candidatus Ornithospirochaeta avicola]|uniref:Oligopeptidase F n=1 Tax=Candidatus Ornithospirochaeta avicola TaxID=2840896 RepID=A0A9D1TNF6_9SPIO|nr:oligoendopeptidase F [Candidatus Ornithospirochaeta avicola]
MERKDRKKEDLWDLSTLSVSDEKWYEDFAVLKEELENIRQLKGKMALSSDSFHQTLIFLEKFFKEEERLGSYAFLKYSADSTNSQVAKMAGEFDAFEASVSEAVSFFDTELVKMDEKKLSSYMAEERNKDYLVFIKKSLRMKEHILSEKEERLLSLYSPVGASAQDIFMDLNNIDLDFGTVNGEKLTHSSFARFIRSEDEKTRKDAYMGMYNAYLKNGHTIARIYSSSIKGDIFLAKARGYGSSLEKALFPDKIDQSVYRNLISTIHEALPSLNHFYEVKAKALNKDHLMHYDVYLSMTKGVESRHTYDEAVSLISKAIEPLGEDYRKTLIRGLTEEHWVDKYENTGKRSGAFSSGSYTGHAYILTNFEEEVLDSVFTLIHEGGHSMHSYYSVKNNPFMSYNYTIFEAEVASTFNEELLMHYLLKNTDDKNMRMYLISKKLDDMVATLFRQTMFAEYELIVHEAAERGEALTFEFFRQEYRKLLELYFGPKVKMLDVSDLEGLRIPHFYRAFYTYKYATGLSASIALARRVLSGGEKERNEYLSFLSSGGSKYPLESLKEAGVDMSKPDPVREATKQFKEYLAEFERLASEN